MKNSLIKILNWFCKLILKKYKTKIVAITGSAGKTSTKEAVFSVLSPRYFTRKNEKNFNTDLGVAMTILGIEKVPGKNLFNWLGIFGKAVLYLALPLKFPEILVLELGADKPNDIKNFMKFITPTVSIVTAIGTIPAHSEFFSGPEAVKREKSEIVKALLPNGLAILNYDDPMVLDMRNLTSVKTLSFGFNEGADLQASDLQYLWSKDRVKIDGLIFKVNFKGKFIPIRLQGIFGRGNVYSALAAVATGDYFNINLVNIDESLAGFRGLEGRLRFLDGIKNSLIIDDTYNASPASMMLALDTLNDIGSLTKKRKVAVLGDMLELGKLSEGAHYQTGEKAARIVDSLILFGGKTNFIKEGALHGGMLKEKINVFNNKEDLLKNLDNLIRQNDIILVKASRGMKFEGVVGEIMKNPERAKELLVHS